MKKKILISLAILGALLSFQSCDKDEDIVFPEYPQDKLQFSKVVYVELYTTLFCVNCSFALLETIVVAQNKALKIESINVSENNMVYFNNLNIDAIPGDIAFPIWLPTGSYALEIRASDVSFNTRQIKAILSGLEYNIVP